MISWIKICKCKKFGLMIEKLYFKMKPAMNDIAVGMERKLTRTE